MYFCPQLSDSRHQFGRRGDDNRHHVKFRAPFSARARQQQNFLRVVVDVSWNLSGWLARSESLEVGLDWLSGYALSSGSAAHLLRRRRKQRRQGGGGGGGGGGAR